jgi:hypothetical protein
MTDVPRKMVFVVGETSFTFTPDDIEAVWSDWEREHPGKRADRDMTAAEFSARCMARLKANARPTRTVLHN